MRSLLLAAAAFVALAAAPGAAAQQFVYSPKNPAFGGSPLNYSWMLSSAQAQNSYQDASSNRFTRDPLADFESSLQRQILNQGEVDISDYEIYFRIDTDRGPFYQEIAGADLAAGQLDFGTFRKYLLGARAEAVVILDTAANEGP